MAWAEDCRILRPRGLEGCRQRDHHFPMLKWRRVVLFVPGRAIRLVANQLLPHRDSSGEGRQDELDGHTHTLMPRCPGECIKSYRGTRVCQVT